MAEKNLKPEIRFSGFTDDWKQLKLGEIFEPNVERNENQFGSDKTISIATMVFKIEGNGASKESIPSYKVLRVGDIAFEGHTNKQFRYGRFVLNDIGNGIMSPRFSTLRPKSKIPFRFWKQYIHYEPLMRNVLARSTKSGTMMNELVVPEALEQSIPVPLEKEQSEIGTFFTYLDSLITLHKRKYDKLVSVKKTMLEKMFPKDGENVPEIRFAGFTGAWERRELGEDVADIVGGGTPSTSNPAYWNGNIDWYSPTEIGKKVYADRSEKKITELGLQKSSAKMLPANRTVLFTSRAGIGDMAILRYSGTTSQGFQSLIIKDGYDIYFVYSMGHLIKKYALKNASGSTFLEVSNKTLEKMKIQVPSFDEQTKIGCFFKNLDDLITLQKRELEKLRNIKKAMLDKMFV